MALAASRTSSSMAMVVRISSSWMHQASCINHPGVSLPIPVPGPSPRGPRRLLARGVDLHRGAAPGSADSSHLPAAAAAAEEPIAAIGFEPRYANSGWHLEPLQDLSRSRIDAPQFAFVTFQVGVPELAVDPGDPGDEAVGLDGAKNRPSLGSTWWIFRSRYCPTQSVPSAHARPESPPPPGAGIVASTRPVFGSIFWMRSSAI